MIHKKPRAKRVGDHEKEKKNGKRSKFPGGASLGYFFPSYYLLSHVFTYSRFKHLLVRYIFPIRSAYFEVAQIGYQHNSKFLKKMPSR